MTIAEIIAAKKRNAAPATPAPQADPMLDAAINRIDPPSVGKRRAGLVLSASTPLAAADVAEKAHHSELRSLSKPHGEAIDMARGDQQLREQPVHHARPERAGGDMVGGAGRPRGTAADPVASPALGDVGAPGDGQTGERAVLTISERLAANARKLREKPCPLEHCETCYRNACRLLLKTCCICNGGVILSKTNFFPTTPTP